MPIRNRTFSGATTAFDGLSAGGRLDTLKVPEVVAFGESRNRSWSITIDKMGLSIVETDLSEWVLGGSIGGSPG